MKKESLRGVERLEYNVSEQVALTRTHLWQVWSAPYEEKHRHLILGLVGLVASVGGAFVDAVAAPVIAYNGGIKRAAAVREAGEQSGEMKAKEGKWFHK